MNKLNEFSRAILAIAIMLCVALPTLAHDFEVGGIYYNYLDETAKTVAVTYKGSYSDSYSNEYTGSVAIPSSVTYSGTTYSVTSIGDGAFRGCTGLTSITIPNSVTTIGNRVFYECSGLTSITIPNSVTSIGSEAFYNCEGLTSITIPNSVTSIGYGVFYYCDGLTSVTIGNSVTEIGDGAFYYCSGLTSITIPNSVTSIGDGAFRGCTGLTSITIPNSVTTIGNRVFYECSGLTSITIPNSVTEIGDHAFYDCDGLTSITIPNSVTSIGSYAFDSCSGLVEVNYNAENCTSMGSSGYPVFRGCSNLKIVNIGSSVKTIPGNAFSGCSGLTSVTIGNSVTQIGSEAFANCGLRLIMSHCAVPPTCNGAVFGGDENNDSYRALLMIPEGSLIDYALADEWHKFTQVHEVSEATVSTQEKNATFEIPTIEGATKYDVTVYTDITMTQLVATTHYDATGKIIPMSTTLELSIDGFEDGVYYYKVLVKSADGEVLNNYIGTFEIDAAGVENIANDSAIEVARYDIHGRLLSEPTPGINIVKMSNGTTRKEIVK